jgi:hypothetical protein
MPNPQMWLATSKLILCIHLCDKLIQMVSILILNLLWESEQTVATLWARHIETHIMYTSL